VIDSSALGFATVFCSGGRRGLEIELAPADLVRATGARVAAITAAPPGGHGPGGPGGASRDR
jgi:Cys-tRNA(Pro)/Cys-tRNA(Cys) deacylase